ncbi:NTF2-domain-containing protein [Aspergillus uvarum CBS 121591]|uniref:NTF2-domain-containing protein n=1 Tax=Aspergillus uvarum CBS 121591 TaxID=1448315 RepID=A0A319C730_9EURO|nr:NTF2-domain-containing protein [Aspergillus uvarum CBS 121591]PYH79639.1 NTF2-domain-containing protein [Aspergillus uvarum CBS 121591]
MYFKAINEKIKQLDFQDCKVRVLNVDSQASFDNILVSVIGEISNKLEPSRKFVQSFVLAEQPNGYYVLNDIFRYLVDVEEELETEEAAPAAAPIAPAEEPAAEEPAAEEPVQPEAEPEAVPAPAAEEPQAEETQVDNETAAAQVDQKLEQAEQNVEEVPAEQSVPKTNGAEVQEAPVEAAPEASESSVAVEAPKVEEPGTPEPTPAPEPKEAPAPAKESAPAAKALPKTWANIASKSGAAVPVVPAIPVAPVKPAAAPAPAPSVASASSSQAAAPAPAQAPAPVHAAESAPSQPPSNDGAGWQTAGHDHKKSQSRAADEQNVLAYIKNVTEKVDASLLKQTLSRFGKLKHFDVSRQKVCIYPQLVLCFHVIVDANLLCPLCRTVPLLNSAMRPPTTPLLLPTPTRSEPSRSMLRSAVLALMPTVVTVATLVAVALAVVVETVSAARVAAASSVMVAEALLLVAVAAMSMPRVATKPKLLKAANTS